MSTCTLTLLNYTETISLYQKNYNYNYNITPNVSEQETEYVYPVHPSAPTAPWYYDRYPIQVIHKAQTVLVTTWDLLPTDWQQYYLDFYNFKFLNNDLDL